MVFLLVSFVLGYMPAWLIPDLGLAENLKKLVVGQEIEATESSSLGLQVVA